MHYWQRQGQSSLPPCPHLGLQAISRSSRSDQGGGSGEAPANQLMVSAVGAGGGDVEGVSRSCRPTMAAQLIVSQSGQKKKTRGEVSWWEGMLSHPLASPAGTSLSPVILVPTMRATFPAKSYCTLMTSAPCTP